MRLTLDLGPLHVQLVVGDQDNGTDPGDCTTNIVGFVPTPADQRWEPGVPLSGDSHG